MYSESLWIGIEDLSASQTVFPAKRIEFVEVYNCSEFLRTGCLRHPCTVVDRFCSDREEKISKNSFEKNIREDERKIKKIVRLQREE